MNRRYAGLAGIALAIVVALAWGCTRVAARRHEQSAWRIVGAPNHRRAIASEGVPDIVAQEFRVPVGPPAAELDVWVIEPQGDSPPIAGTTIVLHGIYDQKKTMTGFGKTLANQAAQRAVLVDLRGHGLSSGDFLTYGQVEARDISMLIESLVKRGALTPPLSIYGPSYGSAVALQAAAVDPRIDKVIAVAGFSSFESIALGYIDHFHPALAWAFSDEWNWSVVDRANELANIDLLLSDNVRAIQNTEARVLIIHGEDDRLIPPSEAHALFEACGPERCRLVVLPDRNHLESMSGKRLNRETLGWIRAKNPTSTQVAN